METSNAAREALRATIEQQVRASADSAAGEATLARALAFVALLEAELQAFANISTSVTASRSAAIRAAIKQGNEPRIVPSPELSEALARKVDAENRLGAAREAVAQIEAEIDDARARVERGNREKIWAAERVLIDEAEAISASFHTRHAELRRDLYRLRAIARVHVPTADGEAGPRARQIGVSRSVLLAINEHGVIGNFEVDHGPRVRNVVDEAVSEYWLKLRDDPDLRFAITD